MIAFAIMMVAGFCNVALGQDFNGTWEGTMEAGVYSLQLVFHIEQTDQGVTVTWDSPDQGGFNLPATATITGNELDVDIPGSYAKYKGTLAGDTLDGVFTQGANMPLRLIRKTGEEETVRRPQEAAIEADNNKPYHAEEVTFTNDGITFAGTLTVPNSGNNFPAVVLIAGSGPHDRNEEVFNHKPFLVLADALSRNGFAVLRYDERGVGATVGGDPLAPTEPLATDAMAALRYLKSRPEVDATRAGLMGHSEGGMIAFMMGARRSADFIVSLAGPAFSGDSISAEQTNTILRFRGMASDATAAQMREKLKHEKDVPWWTFFYEHNPGADIVKTKCPVLALNGEKDIQVCAESNLRTIERLLPKNKRNMCKVYPGLNHLFQHCQTGDINEYGKIEETISPEVLTDIANWIKTIE